MTLRLTLLIFSFEKKIENKTVELKFRISQRIEGMICLLDLIKIYAAWKIEKAIRDLQTHSYVIT